MPCLFPRYACLSLVCCIKVSTDDCIISVELKETSMSLSILVAIFLVMFLHADCLLVDTFFESISDIFHSVKTQIEYCRNGDRMLFISIGDNDCYNF